MYVLWFCNLYARQKLYRYRNFKRMRWERIQMEVLILSSCILVYCLVHSDRWASPSRCLLLSLHAAQVKVCVGTWGQSRDGISRNWILCTFAFNSQNLQFNDLELQVDSRFRELCFSWWSSIQRSGCGSHYISLFFLEVSFSCYSFHFKPCYDEK